MSKETVVAGIVSLLLVGAALAQENQRVRVVSQGSNSITIEVTPDSVGVDTVGADGAKALQLFYRDAVPEYNSTGDTSESLYLCLSECSQRR